MSIDVPALIDSGCDTTIIPQGLAESVGLKLQGVEDKIYAYRESTKVIHSKASITFVGKESRQNVEIEVPVLIALSEKDREEEIDITLGISGIFDFFNINFKKSENKIIFKNNAKFSKMLIK